MIALTSFERRIRTKLLELAADADRVNPLEGCVTYKEIGEYADPEGIHATGPIPNTRPPFRGLNEALGHISIYEVEHGRPMLSALVVNAETRRPGEGFVKLSEHLGFEVGDPDNFWQIEMGEVVELWASDDPTRFIDAAVELVMEELRVLKSLTRRATRDIRGTEERWVTTMSNKEIRPEPPSRTVAVTSFHKDMIEGCQTLKKLGYWPQRFHQEVARIGGVETVRNLLSKSDTSEGFSRLWEMKRLDLSVEAFVLLPWYQTLFSEQERVIARRRLEDHGFDVDQFLRVSDPPSWAN